MLIQLESVYGNHNTLSSPVINPRRWNSVAFFVEGKEVAICRPDRVEKIGGFRLLTPRNKGGTP